MFFFTKDIHEIPNSMDEQKRRQGMNRLWTNKLDEIKWNGWPFTCGLIRPQTYIYGWQHVYVIVNPRSPIFPLRNGSSCGVISLILTSSTMKEEYLWCIASYDHTSPFRTKTNNFLIFLNFRDVVYPRRCFNFTRTNFKAVSELCWVLNG